MHQFAYQSSTIMVDPALRDQAVAAFSFLRDAGEAFRSAFFEAVRSHRIEAGQFVAMEGDACRALPLVLDGRARVYKMGAQGREITLYRIAPGESCILTASCILGDRRFPAFARADQDVEMMLVPSGVVRRWMDQYPAWRSFVFQLIAQRLTSVIQTVDEVAFQRLDARLAAYLLQQIDAAERDTVHATHEAIASELGSSRAVISRQLKTFEQEGLVVLGRGVIAVQDPDGLRQRTQVA